MTGQFYRLNGVFLSFHYSERHQRSPAQPDPSPHKAPCFEKGKALRAYDAALSCTSGFYPSEFSMGREDVTPVLRESRHSNKGRNCIYVLVVRQGRGSVCWIWKCSWSSRKPPRGSRMRAPIYWGVPVPRHVLRALLILFHGISTVIESGTNNTHS